MDKKVLSVIDTAYRATLEEQDDTAVWFTHVLRQSGADITILLTGNAANYAVCGQQPPALSFGAASIDFPPWLDEDLQKAANAGVKLVLLRDDADLRGIPESALILEQSRYRGTNWLTLSMGSIWSLSMGSIWFGIGSVHGQDVVCIHKRGAGMAPPMSLHMSHISLKSII